MIYGFSNFSLHEILHAHKMTRSKRLLKTVVVRRLKKKKEEKKEERMEKKGKIRGRVTRVKSKTCGHPDLITYARIVCDG